MSTTAKKIVELAESHIGKNETDGSHRFFIDVYNKHLPLPRNYKVQYHDDWCAVYDSALAILGNATDIIPIECGVGEKVALAQKMGIWIEDDNHIPTPGEIVVYDWNDKENYKEYDNKGYPRHEGTVIEVDLEKKYFLVAEGNYNDAVTVRGLDIGGRYIRGFISPKYDKEPVVVEKPKEEPKVETPKENQIIAGKEVKLVNVKSYTSETATMHYGTKNGLFYLWDDVVRNGRIRITNRKERVGIKGQVTCWINVSDIGLIEKSEPIPVVPEKEEVNVKAGQKIFLKNAPSYNSETTSIVGKERTGIFYLWDNVVKNGRIRITNLPSRVGVKGQVTCWIDVDSIE